MICSTAGTAPPVHQRAESAIETAVEQQLPLARQKNIYEYYNPRRRGVVRVTYLYMCVCTVYCDYKGFIKGRLSRFILVLREYELKELGSGNRQIPSRTRKCVLGGASIYK